MVDNRVISYSLRRLVLLIISLVGVSVITFLVTNLLPGDVAQMIVGQRADAEKLEAIRTQLGLNRPIWVRYLDWAGSFIMGDFGDSIILGLSVERLIANRLPATTFLAVSALILAVIVAIPMGIIAAIEQNNPIDTGLSIIAFAGISLPNFFWGLVLILIVAGYLNLLPPAGYTNPIVDPVAGFQQVLLPALAVSFALLANLMRMMRSSLLEELNTEYIKLAKSKGLTQRSIIQDHALRNAFLPVLTVIGFQVGALFGGLVVIEEVFAYPGIGQLTFQALATRDIELIQGTIMVIATIFMSANLIVDVLYAVLDPRVGTGGNE